MRYKEDWEKAKKRHEAFWHQEVIDRCCAAIHVNNTKYISWLCDALGRNTLSEAFIGDLVCGYEKEIREEKPYDLSIARKDDTFTFCVASEEGKHFVAGGTLCREGLK